MSKLVTLYRRRAAALIIISIAAMMASQAHSQGATSITQCWVGMSDGSQVSIPDTNSDVECARKGRLCAGNQPFNAIHFESSSVAIVLDGRNRVCSVR